MEIFNLFVSARYIFKTHIKAYSPVLAETHMLTQYLRSRNETKQANVCKL